MSQYQVRRRQIRIEVGNMMNLINLDFYVNLKIGFFDYSRAQHNLEAFSSASAYPHATLPSAPSSDEVTSREMDDLNKPLLLFEADKIMDFIT